MNLTPPLRFLAMAAAMVSAFATQTNAQDPASILACEQFNAAVAEIDGAFVVSGLQAEETNLIDIGDFDPPVPNSITRLQFVSADAPQLTLPMGTITRTLGVGLDTSPSFLERQNITFLVLGSDGGAAEAFDFFNDTYSLEPDASLGIACGFCLTSDSGFFNGNPIEDGVVTFFDGDTQIGQATGPDFSFLAQPGETITRVDFADLRFAYDFQVAFCPDVTPELPPVVEQDPTEAALDFEDVSGWMVINGNSDIGASDVASSGQTSLEVEGAGYSVIQSPELSTADLLPGATEVSVDLFIGSNQPNRYWVGAVQFYVHAPSAHLFNAYVGQIELTGLAQDEFSTLTFDLPQFISQRLNGSFDDVQLRFALNVNRGSGPYFFDNIQFAE